MFWWSWNKTFFGMKKKKLWGAQSFIKYKPKVIGSKTLATKDQHHRWHPLITVISDNFMGKFFKSIPFVDSIFQYFILYLKQLSRSCITSLRDAYLHFKIVDTICWQTLDDCHITGKHTISTLYRLLMIIWPFSIIRNSINKVICGENESPISVWLTLLLYVTYLLYYLELPI